MELINIQNQDGKFLVSSRDVAKNFNKNHADVMKAINNKVSENAILLFQNFFIESSYKVEGNNKTYKEYLMTRDGFSFIVMGFTGKEADTWKLKYIEAFNKMEEALNNKQLPTSYKDALIALVHQVELNEQMEKLNNDLNEKIEIDAPKVEYVDQITQKDEWYDLNYFIKSIYDEESITIGRTQLFKLLRDNHVLMYDNKPYQKFITNKWMHFKRHKIVANAIDTYKIQPVISNLGMVKLTPKIKEWLK